MNPIKTSDIYQHSDDLRKLAADLEALQEQLRSLRDNDIKTAKALESTLRKVTGATAAQRDEIDASSKQAEELTKRIRKYEESLGETAVQIAAVREAQRQLNAVNKLEAKILASKEGSYNKLSAQYSLNKIRLNQLSAEERKNTEEGKKLEKQTFLIYQEMKRLQEATGKHVLSVGDYTKGVRDAAKEQDRLAAELKETKEQFEAANKATDLGAEVTKRYEDRIKELAGQIDSLGSITGKTSKDYEEGFLDKLAATDGVAGQAAQGVQGLSKSFKALLRNPIVLTLGLIVGVLATLFNAFKRSERGAELFGKATAVVQAVLGQLTQIAVRVADGIANAFRNPGEAIRNLGKIIVDQVLNRLKAIPLIAKAALDGLLALWNRDMNALKQSGVDALTAVNQAITGLDADQQRDFAGAIRETANEVKEEAAAFIALDAAKRANRATNRDLVRSIENLTTAEQVYQGTASDTTKSFAEREAAAEKARQALEARAAKEIQLAKSQLSLLNTEIDLRRANGEEINDLLDQQLGAYRAVIAAERDYTLAVGDNERQRAELKQDRLERDLDILIDGFENQKAINERILRDDEVTFGRRAELLRQTQALADESFAKQIQTIEQFTDVAVNANDLIATSDAVLLNQKIRNLGLSEIIEGRLLEIVRERRTVTQDLAEAERELAEAAEKARVEEAKAAENALRQRREAELKAFDDRQALAQSEFDLLRSTEAEKTRFRLEAERARLQEVIRINVELGGELTAVQLETLRNQVEKIDAELSGLRGTFTDIYDLFGFRVTDEAKTAISETIGFFKGQLQELTTARVEAANQEVAAANEAIAAAQRALEIEIQNRNAGFAHSEDTARRELDAAKKRQDRALREQERAQRAQQRIQTIEQATSLTTASAKIWSSFAGLGPIGPFLAIGAIATMWGSFISAKIRAAQLSKRQYREGGLEIIGGGSHASGNDTFLGFSVGGRPAYAERGEAHAIIPADKTRKYSSILPSIVDSLRRGTFEHTFQAVGAGGAPDHEQQQNGSGSGEGLGQVGDDIAAIRRNGERRVYTNAAGQEVEIYKNRSRTYV